MLRAQTKQAASRQMVKQTLLGGAWLSCLVASAVAQVQLPPSMDAGAIQRRTMELDQQLREGTERPAVLKPLETPVPAESSRFQSLTARFLLNRIEFSQSEILKSEELAGFAREFEGREVSLSDLQALLDKINQRYRELGIVTAQGVLPPQEVVGGVVQIRLVEGRIGKILLEGANETRPDYVTAWIKQPTGSLPDMVELERDLIRFNRTHDAQLAAELKPGENFGESDIQLKLAEIGRHDLRFFIDNQGSYSTGELRTGLMYQNRSVFGLRDNFGFNYSHSEGHDGYGFSYALPINTWGTRLAGTYNQDKTHVRHGAFQQLNITGEAQAYGLDLKHPLYFDSKSYLEGTFGVRRREVLSWISGVPLQDTRTDDAHLTLDWQMVDAGGFWNASVTYLSGQAELSGASDKNYQVLRGNIRRVQDLAPGWSLRGNLSFQHTDDRLLPSSEQFMIGGEGTVRGYQMGLYSGDRGYVFSAELHHPLPVPAGEDIKLSGYFFLDHGMTQPYRPVGSNLGVEEISGAGWGVNVSLGKWLTSRVSLALPLRDRPEERKDYYITAQIIAAAF